MSNEISKEMREFSNSMEKLRKDFPDLKLPSNLKVIRFEPTWGEKLDKLLKSSSPKSTEDISKIYDLCKNHPADLSESDKDAYIASIKDLRKQGSAEENRRQASEKNALFIHKIPKVTSLIKSHPGFPKMRLIVKRESYSILYSSFTSFKYLI